MAEARITVDELEFIQFIHLLGSREEIRNAIDAIAVRGVLILGRFGDGGLEVLRPRGATLRDEGYLPILFDFERPAGSGVVRWQCVCGAFPFSEGRIYLFFAERVAKSSYSVVLCGGTKRASEASDDLKYLRSIPVLRSSGSVFGTVFRYSEPESHNARVKLVRLVQPAVSLQVKIIGPSQTDTTSVNRDGSFKTIELTPGTYRVELEASELVTVESSAGLLRGTKGKEVRIPAKGPFKLISR